MNLDIVINYMITMHASLGALALMAGMVALVARKGSRYHKKAGKVFLYAMLFSAVLAMIIALMPGHESAFLSSIGIFSTYFLLTGYRALSFYKGRPCSLYDRLLSWTMLVTGIFMVFFHLVMHHSINVVLMVFGIMGIIFATRDLRSYSDGEKLKRAGLKMHLGNMTGAYISATTAFVVVNKFLPGIMAWFLPGIAGGIYIAFWINKLDKNDKRSKV